MNRKLCFCSKTNLSLLKCTTSLLFAAVVARVALQIAQLETSFGYVSAVDFPILQVFSSDASLHPPVNSQVYKDFPSYDPARYPVFPDMSKIVFPIRVGIISGLGFRGEAKHLFLDGVKHSRYMELVAKVEVDRPNMFRNMNPTSAQLWLVDLCRVGSLTKQQIQSRTFLNKVLFPSKDGRKPSWTVLIIDMGDHWENHQVYYEHYLEGVLQAQHIRIAARAIVQNRTYLPARDDQPSLLIPGKIIAVDNDNPWTTTRAGPMLHTPYPVRSDIVATLLSILVPGQNDSAGLLRNHSNRNTMPSLDQLANLIGNQTRYLDAVHLWAYRPLVDANSRFRNDVSRVVASWNGQSTLPTEVGSVELHRSLVTMADQQGSSAHWGRNEPQLEYIQTMLHSKIVIVVQRMGWEDHYRLMEALVSGAMVMSDTMLAPPKGLVHGESIVFFKSLRELSDLVSYYLLHGSERQRIARNGFLVAMGRHRSWHRLEELLFGRPLTAVRPTNVSSIS